MIPMSLCNTMHLTQYKHMLEQISSIEPTCTIRPQYPLHKHSKVIDSRLTRNPTNYTSNDMLFYHK